MWSSKVLSRMAWACAFPQGMWRADRSGIRRRRARPCRRGSTGARPRRPRRGRLVLHHGVVVDVGHGPALVADGGEGRRSADHDGLEVHHQVATERGVVAARQEQEARRLDRAAGHDDHLGVHRALHPVGADVVDAGGPAALDADARHEGLGHQLGPTGGHGPGQEGDGVALGVDRDTRRRRRTRSCCRPAGRRRERCWQRSVPRRGGARRRSAAAEDSMAPYIGAPGGIG